MNDFAKGIITGIVSSAIFTGIVLFVKNILFPWIQNFFHDIPNVSGNWQIYYSNDPDEKSAGKLNAKQLGRKINGSANIFRNRIGAEVNRNLKFHGSFRGGQILIFYEDEKLKGQIVGVTLLRLIGDKDQKEVFTGKSMYCHPTQESVEAYDLCLKR